MRRHDWATDAGLRAVISRTLRQHAVTSWSGENHTSGHCLCSATLTAERPTFHAWTRALSDHQASAILAAIGEAGNEECCTTCGIDLKFPTATHIIDCPVQPTEQEPNEPAIHRLAKENS